MRLFRHLSDARHPKCRDALLGNPAKYGTVSPEEQEQIQLHSRLQRKIGRAQGHSHAIAQGEATTLEGRVTGRVQR